MLFSKELTMTLVNLLRVQGSWLFRWRSYLPIALLALLLPPSLLGLHWPFESHRFHDVWEIVSLLISLFGLAIRCVTVAFVPKGTSGRGTRRLSAEALNSTGMYSLVRHPVYLGNYLVGLGVTLVWFDWWAPVIYSLCFWLYYERIIVAEEAYLEGVYGDEFREWARRTPSFCLMPSQFAQWKRPAMSFSLLSMVRREYSTFLLIVLLYAGMEGIENYWIDGRLSLGAFWSSVLLLAIALYISLAILNKQTRLLKIRGR
jgi:protein-S-isoprenylcysteine O-methyltransferase Ste14